MQSERDDVPGLAKPGSVQRELLLGLGDLFVDTSLLALEGPYLDRFRVVRLEQLLPLGCELAEPPPQEDGGLRPVALSLGYLLT